ncbi:DUF3152 domain-containing protein [Actinoplanes sp. NPDC051513]|uniref:DUF3152 domain-containing protein n=1 Tax=Actinoplanes sp. NPDC051513 TaxID=3363908 RepID=UPI00378A2754
MSQAPLARPAPPSPPDLFPDFDEETRGSRRRRRVLTVFAYLLLAAAVVFLGRYLRADDSAADRIVVPVVVARPSTAPFPSKVTTTGRAVGASGTFAYVTGYGQVLGGAGPIRRFRIAVEKPAASLAPTAFAAVVDRTLGDRRSWIAAGRFRLQRVPPGARAEFTIYLASARTSEKMCHGGGLETGAYTSCRLPGKVIINDDRWERSVRGYGAPLTTYRAYAINHEVGHQLGHGHEACPGKGRPAPVMMQQTFGLKGCTANSWPYPGGRRYSGPPAP